MVEYDTIETLNDTQFVPIVEKAMAPADIEYRLDVWFDVSGACIGFAYGHCRFFPSRISAVDILSQRGRKRCHRLSLRSRFLLDSRLPI